MLLIGPGFMVPVPVFSGSGHFSSTVLHQACHSLAERQLEHRRSSERYEDAVAYTSWKIATRIKKDIGYKIWAAYNDCLTLYATYWKVCYFASAVTRALQMVE